MTNLDKEFLILWKKYCHVTEEGEQEFIRDSEETGGFIDVKEKEGDLVYTDKNGDTAEVCVYPRLYYSLVSWGDIEAVEELDRLENEEFPDIESLRKPLGLMRKRVMEYIQKIRNDIELGAA